MQGNAKSGWEEEARRNEYERSDEKREALILSLTMDNGGNHRRNTFHFLSFFIFSVSSVDTRFLSREREERAPRVSFRDRIGTNFFRRRESKVEKKEKKGKKKT